MNLLTNRVFTTILITDIIQQMAIWIRNISIMFFMMEATNDNPIAISTLNFVEFAPMFLFTFVGGIIADKQNPKKLMLLGDSLSFISFVILSILIGRGMVGAIFIAVLISAIVTQFSYPASQKYFKEYIDEEHVESAIGISQLLGSLFAVIGPFIGSHFYFTFGIDKTLFIISILFVISIVFILTLPNKEFDKIESDGFIEDIKLTFKYINEKKILKVFMYMFLVISFGLGIANNLDIFLVTQRLGLSEEEYKFFSGIAGFGMIIGGIIYVYISKYELNLKYLYIMMGLLSVTIFLEGYSTVTEFTMILQFIDNVIGGILGGIIMSMITKITDQKYLGKVNGLTSTLMYLGIMAGTLVSGVVMKYISIVVAYSIASISFIFCTLILFIATKKGIFSKNI